MSSLFLPCCMKRPLHNPYSSRRLSLLLKNHQCINNHDQYHHLQSCIIPRRLFSSSSSSSSQRNIIPEPTWSIQELQLTSNHPTLPKEEVQRLSRRALIHIDDDNNNNNNDNNDDDDDLRQDLANMMHMVEQISNYSSSLSEEEKDGIMDANEIYDRVRGVTAAPLRRSSTSTSTSSTEMEEEEDKAEAASVWESQLKPNTIKIGGSHHYFVITTKED